MHKLWDRYQLQENEIGRELFKENDDVVQGNDLENNDYADGDEDLYAKKRMVGGLFDKHIINYDYFMLFGGYKICKGL